jgi:TolB protein
MTHLLIHKKWKRTTMHKLHIILLCTFIHTHATVDIAVSGAQQTQMPIAIISLNAKNTELQEIANIIKKDLQFTDQFNPSIKQFNITKKQKLSRKNIQQLSTDGIPLALCLHSTTPDNIEWRLYDTMQCTMIYGNKYSKNNPVARIAAHAIADSTRKVLTGHDGFFLSRLTYCKESKNNHGHTIRKVYISDFDGSNEELLVDIATICIAPRWHAQEPLISYSEYTNTNMRLMTVAMDKSREPFSTLDGINMLMSISPSGNIKAYCASRGSGSSQIYLLHNNNNLKRCTQNSGNNTSPIFIDEDHLCLCSDFQTGSPQIYIGNITTGHLQRITHGGYCTSPHYCPVTKKIVYHKMISGVMQIMMYDCLTKMHTQLTTSPGNKYDASFSPDGTQLLFTHAVPRKNNQLCSFNLLTNTTKRLSTDLVEYSYPHWSPCYKNFPTVIT